MKHIRHHILPALWLLASASCQVEEINTPDTGEMTFYASNEAGTRTTLLADGSVLWSPADEISIFCDNAEGKFVSTNTTTAGEVEFKGTLEGTNRKDGDYYWAVYPFREDNSYSDGQLTLTLPSEQQAVEGAFADDLFISVARSTNNRLYFQNVCGGVKFALVDEGIKKVIFRGNQGEPVAGTVKVDFENNVPVIMEVLSSSSEITLTAPDGGTFQPGRWYYIVCLPGKLAGGFSIDLFSEELIGTKSGRQAVTVKRSVWGVLPGLSPDVVGIHPVDLGLPSGILWASCDLGADRPEKHGKKYAWGEIESKNHISWEDYTWCEGTQYSLFKYCYREAYGEPDYRTWLDREDDAAHILLGEDWWTPTYDEFLELYEHAIWTYISDYQGTGVAGIVVSGKTQGYENESIFFPLTQSSSGANAYYRMADQLVTDPWLAEQCSYTVDLGVFKTTPMKLCAPFPTRPVYGRSPVPIDEFIVQKEGRIGWDDYNENVLLEGAEGSLVALVISPDNAWPRDPKKDFDWFSSDNSVATVSDGYVHALKAGSTTISATPRRGGVTQTFDVTVRAPVYCMTPQAVDMGVSIKWGSFNLGATTREESGYLFRWGEVEPATTSYKWDLLYRGVIKYIPTTDNPGAAKGYYDGLNYLLPEDDAATAKLGEKWRMPLYREWKELMDNCTFEISEINGQSGYVLTSRITGNQLFFPRGAYWTKTLHEVQDFPDLTDCKEALVVDLYPNDEDRFLGSWRGSEELIRPILDEATGEQIPLDEEHFPDPVFRDYLALKYDINADNLLGPGERNILEMDVNDMNLESLRGLEYFPSLRKLACTSNNLTKLDVTENVALTDLWCSYNNLISLDVSRNTELSYLSCAHNQLTNLDISKNTALQSLRCQDNMISELDLAAVPHLQSLFCDIPDLDVSMNPELVTLSCSSSGLTSLDVSHNPALTSLSCGNNQLTTLDLSLNPSLTTLRVNKNLLKELDLSKNPRLTTLSCDSNPLEKLDLSFATELETVSCQNDSLTSLKLNSEKLRELDCRNNKLASIDLSKATDLSIISVSDNQLRQLNLNSSAITQLLCENNQLAELNLSQCTRLSRLDCHSNELTSLSLASTQIAYLHCSNNRLTSLDVSMSYSLEELRCANNELTSLMFVKSRLVKLDCSNNLLSELDVTKAYSLVELYCYQNNLTQLDVSGDSNLSMLYCWSNFLTSMDLSSNRHLQEFSCYDNRLTSVVINNCPRLIMLSLNNNKLTSIDVSGSPGLLFLNCIENPLETIILNSKAVSQGFPFQLSAPEGVEIIYV